MPSRRGTPEVLVAALLTLLLASYVWYTNNVVHDLSAEARRSSAIFDGALRAQDDTVAGAQLVALIDIAGLIREQGMPIIIVSKEGDVYAKANLPFDPGDSTVSGDDPRVRAYIAKLDGENEPMVDASGAKIHFGHTKLVRGLKIIPALQALTGAVLLFAFIFIVRTRTNAARERLWSGMARESAHQIGTPLSSLTGWIELIEERAESDPSLGSVVAHMRSDVERLDRVSHRFERIGREPRYELMTVGDSVDRMARYFQARVPTLANTIQVSSVIPPELPPVQGDPVLLEWALEVLIKNAIDALAGRGGTVAITVRPTADEGISIQVADNGPGVPREIRARVFDPGFSTKSRGWGIGLSLAKRIVEENHGGKLTLLPSERDGGGATFEIILH